MYVTIYERPAIYTHLALCVCINISRSTVILALCAVGTFHPNVRKCMT